MNKRYIDFVPIKKGKVDLGGSPFLEKGVSIVASKKMVNSAKVKAVNSTEIKAKRIKATGKDILGKSAVRETMTSVVKKSVENPKTSEIKKTKAISSPKMDVPKNPFINTNRVIKRPLSKNVYHKEIKAPVEEPKGPITIITKPEKGTHVSLIVTIILTIVLGAAAGTVAFLLLPK